MPETFDIDAVRLSQARAAAKRSGRSLAEQIAYWIWLGQAVDESPEFDVKRLQTTLPENLTALESAVFLSYLEEATSHPTKEAEAFFEDRRRRGLGVGLDENGHLVRQKPAT
ncbi:ParD-like antitoxin of type II toxin-antitoxin system [Loktanella atrilutea]|uniref:ParD-like antitoxin of type II toxin-antitoxin system n=1 Tax=Loktanella atrilutea TaxID=366533 RepID=A0A1M5FLY2_LOKAT|nr:hypothetical protein [Loktanella atrilutea]SHF92530.1 ParD-like antitoxin of type II toxin-antitoxin system [Loktanella atrilutea]